MRLYIKASSLALSAVFFTQAPIALAADLEEIIVTAQKREQSIQDVPIAITAITGERLDANIVQDIFDLRVTVPSLEVRAVDPPSQGASLAIRGLGTSVFNMGFEPTVGTFVDGVYVSRSGLIASSDLLDLDRVEVLKGPQGTLFGKNTTGGVVHFLTNKPTFEEVEGFAELTLQEYNQVRVRGAINVPVNDTLAMRFSGSYHKGDGYLDNVNGDDANDRDRFTIRGQLMWQPNDDFSLRLIADYSEVDENCCWPVRNTNAPLNQAFNVPAAALIGSSIIDPPDPDNLRVAINGDLVFESEDIGLSAEMNWNIGDMTLTSITAYRDHEDINIKDNDFTGVDVLVNTDTLPEVSLFSEELRLAGGNDKVEWLVGAFYSTETVKRTREFVWGPQITLFPFFAPGLFGNVPGRAFFDSFEQDADTIAGFGHATFSLTDQLSLTAGVRYTKDEKEGSHRGEVGNQAAPFNNFPLAIVHDFDAERDDSETTGMLSLKYDFNDDVMAFVTYSQGFKSGGISLNRDAAGNAAVLGNPGGPCPPGGTPSGPLCTFAPGDPTFEPETADHYEVGIKSTLLDNRLRLNASAWLTDFEDLQVQTLRPDGSFDVSNVAGAKSQGMEAEIQFVATDHLDINFSLQYLDATYDDEVPALTPGGPVLGGQDLPFASEWTGSLGLGFDAPFNDSGWDFFANANLFFRTEYFPAEPDEERVQGSYSLLNFRTGLRSESWEFSAWCRNCTDERYKMSDFAIPFDGVILAPPGTPLGTAWSHYGAPRFVGGTAKYRF